MLGLRFQTSQQGHPPYPCRERQSSSLPQPSPASPAQQAADAALTDALRASAPKVRPVNAKEAARGKVDYVQVRVCVRLS